LKIWIIPLNKKRKLNELTDDDIWWGQARVHPLCEEEETEATVETKVCKEPMKGAQTKHTRRKGKETTPLFKAEKRGHGHPADICVLKDCAVATYGKIIIPPVMIYGRSAKGNKLKAQDPELMVHSISHQLWVAGVSEH